MKVIAKPAVKPATSVGKTKLTQPLPAKKAATVVRVGVTKRRGK